MRLEYRPLSDYPGVPTPSGSRRKSPFSAQWGATMDELKTELAFLGAKSIVLEIEAAESEIRLDGTLRAGAKVVGPKVVLSFDSKHGDLRYSADRFTKWQDNVRAIAVGLENLRRLERYGIASRAEQYTGYKALPAAKTAPEDVIATFSGGKGRGLPDQYKNALKNTHPDAGGDPADFELVRSAGEELGL